MAVGKEKCITWILHPVSKWLIRISYIWTCVVETLASIDLNTSALLRVNRN